MPGNATMVEILLILNANKMPIKFCQSSTRSKLDFLSAIACKSSELYVIELNFGYELLAWFYIYHSDRTGAICYLLLFLPLLLLRNLAAG